MIHWLGIFITVSHWDFILQFEKLCLESMVMITIYCMVPLQYGKFSPKYSQQTTHSSLVGVRYELSVVRPYFDLCSTLVSIVLITLRPRQDGRHFPDDIFKCIFLNENVWIPIIISLKFVPKGPINYIPALVQIMAWRRPGDKPLSEAMMVRLLTHMCVTRPQWVIQCCVISDNVIWRPSVLMRPDCTI